MWTYTLDNSNAAVQALNVGQTLTDTFTVTTVDGTSQLVTITINGANDAAVITGPVTGTVTEAGGVANGTPGTRSRPAIWTADRCRQSERRLDARSARRPQAPAATAPTRSRAAGVWTYTLDNTNATVQALNVGQTLTDSFTVSTVDGTSQLVTDHHQRCQ